MNADKRNPDRPKDPDLPPRSRIEEDLQKEDPEDVRVGGVAGGDDLHLPHERDEVSAPGDAQGPRQVIEQAASDLGRGLRDTDRGIPSDVPSPGPGPDDSPGADVPAEGVSRTRYGRHQGQGGQAPAADEPGEGERPGVRRPG